MARYVGGITMSGSSSEPDYIYYNADIINNNSVDKAGLTGIPAYVVLPDPQIRFNETRDKALIRNAGNYHFSIVRFSMNGANLDLPLFIPSIVSGQVYDAYGVQYGLQSVYSMTFSYQQFWNVTTSATPIEITAQTIAEYMYWRPQNRNPVLAPPPALNEPIGPTNQNIASRWWWANDYTYVLSLINTDVLQYGWNDLYLQFAAAWSAATTDPIPYPTFADFVNGVGAPPQITWDSVARTMTFYADSSCFGQRLESFVDLATPGTPSSVPYCRVFMNNNMYGLFSGFSTIYYNLSTIPATYPAAPGLVTPAFSDLINVDQGTQELIFTNKFYQNIADYRTANYSGVPPLGYVPTAPYNLQKVYWSTYQDFSCVDTLWSPIASLVFQSSLMPIVKEAINPPTDLGSGNLSQSIATTNGVGVAASAFSPIITDVSIDQFGVGAEGYRHFLYYAPTAEYRMADTAGNQDIRNIDISVFWKARLTGQIYPIEMFNLSNVSIKVMFRKKGVDSVKDAY